MDHQYEKDANGNLFLNVALTDYALLHHSLLNKGMAFTHQEREEFNLLGLLPPHETDLATQRARSYEAFKNKATDLEKYIYLRDLQNSNETLFYNLLCEHITELMPIVYTPVVGLGCQHYSHIYRRPRGVYIAYPDKNNIDKILANRHFDRIRVIVVSDGERILGLGDQGAGGMGIPIGKLALYTACAGIYPDATLPILLDTGTNNKELLKDPLYIGWHHERIRDQDYADFVDAFVRGVKKRFPHVLLQWEDFAQLNANTLLERYRHDICSFNDDIQGTAAVAAGALFAAIRVTGTPLRDQRIVVFGAGSAGCGISHLIKKAMIEEGLSESDARSRFYMIDRQGLLIEDMELLPFQKPFAQNKNAVAHWQLENPSRITLKDVVSHIHPTCLIGVSGQAGVFTEEIIRDLAKYIQRPVIFPLSNPTHLSEATPSDLMKWTNEMAIIGTGSPFDNITKHNQPFRVDQTNNSYIFPGMGLGLIAVNAREVTDTMLMHAAKALADCSPAIHNPDANILPPLTEIKNVSFHVALAIAKEAIAANLTDFKPRDNLEEHIRHHMWAPEYLPYKRLMR